jgi:3-hydroxyisobutyrate dehydrogenase
VDAEAALSVINGASGRSAATEVNFPRWILPGSFDSGFTAGLMRKDVRLALELAGRVGGGGTLMEEVGRLWMQASQVPDGADFNRVAAELWQAEAGDA